MRTEDQFRLYAKSLYSKTEHLSVTRTHYSEFQAILQMGDFAVRMMLEDLREERQDAPLWHWFSALNMLTKQWPVKPADAGRYHKIREAWVKWGVQKGIIAPPAIHHRFHDFRRKLWNVIPFNLRNWLWRVVTRPNRKRKNA